MKKRYMDFVPATGAAKRAPVKTNRGKAASKAPTKPRTAPKAAKRPATASRAKKAPAKVTKTVGFAGEQKPKLGAVENLNTRFVRSDVPKRPLSRRASGVYQVPKTNFVKANQAPRRPLSKNVYAKKPVVTPKEEPKGPVTIIAKPEKQAHVGMIVTIILTIILGAAAGTVAFLLLPK